MSVVVLVGEVQQMQLQLSSVVIEPSAGGVLQGSDQIRSSHHIPLKERITFVPRATRLALCTIGLHSSTAPLSSICFSNDMSVVARLTGSTEY